MTFLTILSKDVEKAQVAAYNIEQFYAFPSMQDPRNILRGLKT